MECTIETWWSGVDRTEETRKDPSWEDVQEAILQLDQIKHSSFFLNSERGSHLGIGGGGGLYHVYYGSGLDEDEYYLTLIDPKKQPDETVRLITGGQLGIFPAQEVVDLAPAFAAARYFLEHDERNPDLTWRE